MPYIWIFRIGIADSFFFFLNWLTIWFWCAVAVACSQPIWSRCVASMASRYQIVIYYWWKMQKALFFYFFFVARAKTKQKKKKERSFGIWSTIILHCIQLGKLGWFYFILWLSAMDAHLFFMLLVNNGFIFLFFSFFSFVLLKHEMRLSDPSAGSLVREKDCNE